MSNSTLQYVGRRVLVVLIVALVMAAVRKATAAGEDYTLAGPAYMPTIHRGFMLNVVNPTASPVVVTYPGSFQKTQVIQTWPGRVTQPYNSAGSFTVPANGTYQFEFMLNFTGGTAPGNWTGGPYAGITDEFALTFTVGGVAKPWSINKSATYHARAGAVSLTPYPVPLGDFYAAAPPPLGKITVIADGAAAGSRQIKIGSAAETNVTLVAGSNVVLNSSNPASYADGSVVLVKQFGVTIGTGTIAKDSFGNFDSSINATGVPASGLLTVSWPALFNGETGILSESGAADVSFSMPSSGTYTGNYTPASVVPNGTLFTVKVNSTEVGSGVVVYNPDGSWVVNIVCQGETDKEINDNEGLFVLDLAAFNSNPLALVLVVDGVEYSVGTITGNSSTGLRTVKTMRLPNPEGLLNGRKYSWRITGVDGSNIYQGVTIAGGITPSVVATDGVLTPASYGFRVDNSGTISGDSANPPPANDYDPADPPVHDPGATPEEIAAENKRVEEKRDNYEAMNKAVSDAVNSSTVPNATMPGTGQGQEGGALGDAAAKAATAGIDGAADAAGLSASIPVGTWSGTSALSITLPGAGTVTLNAADYGIAPAVFRAVILMGLLWVYVKVAIQVFRGSMAD